MPWPESITGPDVLYTPKQFFLEKVNQENNSQAGKAMLINLNLLKMEPIMNAISKFLLVFSVFAFSAFAQAEGVSQDDIDRGNNPAVEIVDIGVGT